MLELLENDSNDSDFECKENPFPANVLHAARNPVTRKPGLSGIARNSETLLQIFSLFSPQSNEKRITDHINKKLKM